MQKVLDRIHLMWIPIAGIALIGCGIYLFLHIKSAEEHGQLVRMKKAIELIYILGGKYTVLALFEISGLGVLITGIRLVKD
jgi:hypothetical protein